MFKVENSLNLILVLACALLIYSCAPETKTNQKKKYNNITVLLDLSDRVLTPGQIERDKVIIETIFETFQSSIRKNLYFGSQDKFQVRIARQENNPNTLKMGLALDQLYFDMSTVPVQKKKSIKDISIVESLDKLYDLAKYSELHNDYKGADIVGFLRDDLLSTIKDSSQFKNKLIILTDGYLYVDGAHKGSETWPAVANLHSTDIALFELNPVDYKSGELQKMKSRLQNWFNKMNAGKIVLEHTTGISSVKNEISNFIGNKITHKISSDSDTKKKTTEITKLKLNPNSPSSNIKIQKKSGSDKLNDSELSTINKNNSEELFEEIATPDKIFSPSPLNENSPKSNSSLLTNTKKKPSSSSSQSDVLETSEKVFDISIWYSDYDKDGLGDPHSIQEVTEGTRPIGTWVKNADDKCPNRKGTIEGCPILHVESINDQILIGKEVDVTADPNGLLQSDELKWSGNSSLEFLTNGERSVNLLCNEVGKYKIKYKVQNAEFPIDGIAEREIEVKISSDQIRDIIQPVVVQGVSKGAGKFEQNSKKAMDELFRHTLSKRIPVFDELGIERDPLETFLTSDIKLGYLRTNMIWKL